MCVGQSRLEYRGEREEVRPARGPGHRAPGNSVHPTRRTAGGTRSAPQVRSSSRIRTRKGCLPRRSPERSAHLFLDARKARRDDSRARPPAGRRSRSGADFSARQRDPSRCLHRYLGRDRGRPRNLRARGTSAVSQWLGGRREGWPAPSANRRSDLPDSGASPGRSRTRSSAVARQFFRKAPVQIPHAPTVRRGGRDTVRAAARRSGGSPAALRGPEPASPVRGRSFLCRASVAIRARLD